MDADPNHFAKDKVHQFIQYDYNDHTCDPFHARNIVDQLNNLDLDIDGCLTVWEDCVPLTANICKIMGLTGKFSTTGDNIIGPHQAKKVKIILHMRKVSLQHGSCQAKKCLRICNKCSDSD